LFCSWGGVLFEDVKNIQEKIKKIIDRG
jgi:hypothetical protein